VITSFVFGSVALSGVIATVPAVGAKFAIATLADCIVPLTVPSFGVASTVIVSPLLGLTEPSALPLHAEAV
jgi:hypothetical protein